MKTRVNNQLLLIAMITGFGLISAAGLTAQTFTTLYSFPAYSGPNHTNSVGTSPEAGVILSGRTLYGTAIGGGSSGNGTVFKVNTDGTGFTTLHSFPVLVGIFYTNSDGARPYGGLILAGDTLYGTATGGGIAGNGSVFKVNTDGTGFTNLHSFTATSGPNPSTNSDGAFPRARLILSDNTLYGTAPGGGRFGNGTVFQLATDGTGFTNLHSFIATSGPNPSTNNEGAAPRSQLILSDNSLYGTANGGGSSGFGTVFKINTDGTGFTNLYNFTARSGFNGINSDGASPVAGLLLSGGTLYGTAAYGGTGGNGTVFKINMDGTGFTNLHSFTALSGPRSTNTDGSFVYAGLALSGNALYGTAAFGGSSGYGTVFKLNTDGADFMKLHSFTGLSGPLSTNLDGIEPFGGVIVSDNTLYGTAFYGGHFGSGTIFSLALPVPPRLTISRSETNVVLSWSTNAVGFTLQSTPNLVPPSVWSTVFPAPLILDGENIVTNAASGTQKFYRLSQ